MGWAGPEWEDKGRNAQEWWTDVLIHAVNSSLTGRLELCSDHTLLPPVGTGPAPACLSHDGEGQGKDLPREKEEREQDTQKSFSSKSTLPSVLGVCLSPSGRRWIMGGRFR